jgi:hypothetical protein
MMVANGIGTDRCGPWIIERAIRDVRDKIDGLPEGFSFHDYAGITTTCGTTSRRCSSRPALTSKPCRSA